MPTCVSEEKRYRATPGDGHAILLMEPSRDHRTFSDYPDIVTLLDTIIKLYEESREAKGLPRNDFVLDHLHKWLEDFYKLEVFIFDKEIARYKQLRLPDFKILIMRQIMKCNEQRQSNGNCDDSDMDMSDDERDERWD